MLKGPKSIYILRYGSILIKKAFDVIMTLMSRYAPAYNTIITTLSLQHVSTWIWHTEAFIWQNGRHL